MGLAPTDAKWFKTNKKLMNEGDLKKERIGKFKQLLELGGQYNRKSVGVNSVENRREQ